LSQANEKSLKVDLDFADNVILYLEKRKADKKPIVIHKFELEKNVIEVRFNLIGKREFDQELNIDQRHTIQYLKEQIAQVVKLPIDQFRLCRNLLSKEYKEDLKTIQESGVFDGSAVYIEQGIPLKMDEYKICFFLVENVSLDKPNTTASNHINGEIIVTPELPPPPLLLPEDKEPIEEKFTSLFEIGVSENMILANLKVDIIHRLLEREIIVDSIYKIRLREKNTTKSGKILKSNEKTFKENLTSIYDSKEIIVQILDHDEILSDDNLVTVIARWYPTKWELGSKCEFIVFNYTSASELRLILSQKFNIPFERVFIARPLRLHLRDLTNMTNLNWNINDAITLSASPWYIHDGDLLIFKDNAEIDKIGITGSHTSDMNHPKEKGLKILNRREKDTIIEAKLAANSNITQKTENP